MRKKKVQVQKKVVVIGAGISGLTAAAYLAGAGHPVTLYEQSPEVGGVTATIGQDGFSWDLGPLLLEGFAPDERAGRILKEIDVADRVPLKEGDRGYVFPDFDLRKPEIYEGPNWRRDRMKELFPAEQSSVDSYYAFYNQVMNLVTLNMRAGLTHGPAGQLLKLRLWRAYNKVKLRKDWSAQQLMDHFFVDERLKAIFTSILADFVVRPSRFPALGIPVLNVENSFDRRIPRRASSAGKRPSYHYILGGCGVLVGAIGDRLREKGARIYTNATVEKILVDGDRVRGVELAGGHVEQADIVIATGGARETFLRMVGREYLTAGFAYLVDELELMESVLMVQLGVDLDPRPYQPGPLCYYYGTYDIEGGVAACQRGAYHEGRDGFVVYIPSLHSPEMAPARAACHHNLHHRPQRIERGHVAEPASRAGSQAGRLRRGCDPGTPLARHDTDDHHAGRLPGANPPAASCLWRARTYDWAGGARIRNADRRALVHRVAEQERGRSTERDGRRSRRRSTDTGHTPSLSAGKAEVREPNHYAHDETLQHHTSRSTLGCPGRQPPVAAARRLYPPARGGDLQRTATGSPCPGKDRDRSCARR